MIRKILFPSMLAIALLLGLVALTLAPNAVQAQTGQERFVDGASGVDNGDCIATPCATIGYALTQSAAGDAVQIAAGEYIESVTLDKAVSLLGAGAETTIVRAQPNQRVLTIVGNTIANSTVISGLTFTEGSPVAGPGGGIFVEDGAPTIRDNHIISNSTAITENGGGLYLYNADGVHLFDNFIGYNSTDYGIGGGIYIESSHAVELRDNVIELNRARSLPPEHGGGQGGGLYVLNSDNLQFEGNSVKGNQATTGGGLYLNNAPTATLTANIIEENIANHLGGGRKHYGGAYIYNSRDVRIVDNKIRNNWASDDCGGLILRAHTDNAVVAGNVISGNWTGVRRGGGLCLDGVFDVTLTGNVIIGNHAGMNQDPDGRGGGIFVRHSRARLINNLLADNRAVFGGGLYAVRGDLALLHNTVVGNRSHDGSGIYIIDQNTLASNVILTNTVLADHTIGITVTAGSTVTVDSMLWFSNTLDHGGDGALFASREYTGDPAFVDADNGDYHITCGSAALDRASLSAVTDDIDGDSRPLGWGPDLGSDEVDCSANGPNFRLISHQPDGDLYWFVARIRDAIPNTRYTVLTHHFTDKWYPQTNEIVHVMTDGMGMASVQVGSNYKKSGAPDGEIYAEFLLEGIKVAESVHFDATILPAIGGYGSQLVTQPQNDDWIYQPSPPGPDAMRFWIEDESARSGLDAVISIRSDSTSYLLSDRALNDEGNGLYAYTWSIADLPPADDYLVQMTLLDDAGARSGADGFVRLGGRAMWLWGKAEGGENPITWAIMTNGDADGDGRGDRDALFAFVDAPYGELDPFIDTIYFNVYPYISFNGTDDEATIEAFLAAAHNAGLRIEALAGTPLWVQEDDKLAEGKALCDEIVAFNQNTTYRFDGIHFDVEHDTWNETRWNRYLDLITHCKAQIESYNQSNPPIIFGVDIPPHFKPGLDNSGLVESSWDVLEIVDYLTLMDFRDFADERWDGSSTDGIIPRAEDFIADGNALGKPVVIGVELAPNKYDHVTFFQEQRTYMEGELRAVSRHFAHDRAYDGLAIQHYAPWAEAPIPLPAAEPYGNDTPDGDARASGVRYGLAGQAGDVTIDYEAYDLDNAGEILVYLNGALIAPVVQAATGAASAANDAWSGPYSLLLPGGLVDDDQVNILTFENNKLEPLDGVWGVRRVGHRSEQVVHFAPGWNLFSFRPEPYDPHPSAVLRDIDGRYSQVIGDDELYKPLLPAVFNTLEKLYAGRAYYLRLLGNGAADATIIGESIPVSTPLPLKKGWNWVGYLPDGPLPVETALASIDGRYQLVLSLDEAYDPALPGFSDLAEMKPGEGYLISMTAAATLTYPSAVGAAVTDATSRAPTARCNHVQPTPFTTLIYGDMTIAGTPAPVGTLVEALTPAGAVAGCVEVTTAGQYGFMHVYGADATTAPRISGFVDGDVIRFRVNGAEVETPRTFTWAGDRLPHRLDPGNQHEGDFVLFLPLVSAQDSVEFK